MNQTGSASQRSTDVGRWGTTPPPRSLPGRDAIPSQVLWSAADVLDYAEGLAWESRSTTGPVAQLDRCVHPHGPTGTRRRRKFHPADTSRMSATHRQARSLPQPEGHAPPPAWVGDQFVISYGPPLERTRLTGAGQALSDKKCPECGWFAVDAFEQAISAAGSARTARASGVE
jgi:hypothetical protein